MTSTFLTKIPFRSVYVSLLTDSFLGWGSIMFLYLSLLAMYNTLWYIKGKILTCSWLRRRVQSFQLYPPTNGTTEKKKIQSIYETQHFFSIAVAANLNLENFDCRSLDFIVPYEDQGGGWGVPFVPYVQPRVCLATVEKQGIRFLSR